MTVLLVADDLVWGDRLGLALRKAGVRAVWVRRLQDARSVLPAEPLDALLFDADMLDEDGREWLRELRGRGSRLPVIVLAARSPAAPRLGHVPDEADDLLYKPFAIAELLDRLHVLSPTGKGFSFDCWRVGELCVDIGRRAVTLAGATIALSPCEYALLLELVSTAGRTVGRGHLLKQLCCESDNALEVHVHHLRRKLGGGWVRTVRGVGYQLPMS